MITAYRLIKHKWRDAAFDGQGAKRYGGRWNSKGRACVYLSESISLGLLEIMVHLNDYTLLPSYTLFEVSFEPDDLMQLPSDELPEDWQAYPAPLSTAQIGDQWLQSQASALLAVPSVIVPGEYNYLLNPAHSRFQIITQQARAIDFQMDSRLL